MNPRLNHRGSAIAVILSVSVMVAACSDSQEEPADRTAPVEGTAAAAGLSTELNWETQAVSTPFEQLTLTYEETATLDYASRIRVFDCAAAQRVDLAAPYDGRAELDQIADRSIGVWSEPLVTAYGYAPPASSPQKREMINAQVDDRAREVETACWQGGAVTFNSVIQELRDSLEPSVSSDIRPDGEREQQLAAEWLQCMDNNNIEMDEDSGSLFPLGLEGMELEEQIKIALVDVGCKKSTGYVEDWAVYIADIEAPAIEIHRAEIDDFRSRAESALEEATEVIRAHEG